MRTVAILHYAAPPVVGGVESTIFHHARLLADEGYRVKVIAAVGEQFDPRVEFLRTPEVGSRHPTVLALADELRAGRVSSEFAAFRDRLGQELGGLLADVDVCIVHNAFSLHKNLALTAALFDLNRAHVTRFVAWCHDMAWRDPLYAADLHDGYPWDLLRSAWEGVQYVVVSQHRQLRLAELLQRPAVDVEVVTPGVDVAAFLKLEPETRRLVTRLDLLAADPLMLMPTRITRRKNIEMGLRITAAVRKLHPGVALVVTGPPGPHNPANRAYLDELQLLRCELDLTDRVYFLHEVSDGAEPLAVTDAMMSDFFQLADMLLFPSRHEGFGIPILEAALARLPIFAASIPPVRETAGTLAQLFDLSSAPEEVACLIGLGLSKDERFQLRRRVKQQYTWRTKVVNELIPIIERVAGDEQQRNGSGVETHD